MTESSVRLVFLDMEMTGLNPETDRILEVAAAIVEATPEGLARGITRLREVQAEIAARPDRSQSSLALDPRAGEESRGVSVPYCCSVVYTRLAGLAQLNEWSQENHENSGLLEEIIEADYQAAYMLLATTAPEPALRKLYAITFAAVHPDAGGDHETAVAINNAWDVIRKARGFE